MIRVYRDQSSDRRNKQILRWLTYYRIEHEIITSKNLSRELIEHLLHLSECGFEDLIISRERTTKERRKEHDRLLKSSQTTQELIKELLEHPEFIRSPITFDEQRLLVGFNEDELRMFLPRFYRTNQRNYIYIKEVKQ